MYGKRGSRPPPLFSAASFCLCALGIWLSMPLPIHVRPYLTYITHTYTYNFKIERYVTVSLFVFNVYAVIGLFRKRAL